MGRLWVVLGKPGVGPGSVRGSSGAFRGQGRRTGPPVPGTLTQQPEVKWVEERPVIRPQNVNACALLQGESVGPHPLWDRGLDGTGELAHVGGRPPGWLTAKLHPPPAMPHFL